MTATEKARYSVWVQNLGKQRFAIEFAKVKQFNAGTSSDDGRFMLEECLKYAQSKAVNASMIDGKAVS